MKEIECPECGCKNIFGDKKPSWNLVDEIVKWLEENTNIPNNSISERKLFDILREDRRKVKEDIDEHYGKGMDELDAVKKIIDKRAGNL